MASLAVESPLTGLGGRRLPKGAHRFSGEDVLLDFFVESGGRGSTRRGAGTSSRSRSSSTRRRRCFNIGPASCGVPGVPAGLWEAAQRFASMPFSRLASHPHAREGITVTPMLAYMFRVLEPIVTHARPRSASFYTTGDG